MVQEPVVAEEALAAAVAAVHIAVEAADTVAGGTVVLRGMDSLLPQGQQVPLLELEEQEAVH